LVGAGVVGWLAHFQRNCPSAVEEVLGDAGFTAVVGRVEHAVEVLQKVHLGAVLLLSNGENTRNS